MRGLCKTDCGCMLEYEPHEFSDGFVYYLPRNLDKTIHECFFYEIYEESFFDPDLDIEKIYEENKDRLQITQSKFEEILSENYHDPIPFLENGFENIMSMLREGKLYEFKNFFENQLNIVTIPIFKYGFPVEINSDIPISISAPTNSIISTNSFSFMPKTENELCNLIMPLLTTGKGYQLEILGYIYELMIRFEDAKKCYDLQYECTKEPEFLEKSKQLDKKIKEIHDAKRFNEHNSENFNSDECRKKINSTELKIKKYVVSLFSNNFNELFRKNPSLLDEIKKIRKSDEDSMIEINENNDIETFPLGTIAYILKKSRAQKRSNKNQICSVCGISWKKGDFIYLEKHPKQIMCSDKLCFVKQGGFTKDIPLSLIHRISNIAKARNLHDHPRDYDKEMFQRMLKEAYETCGIIDSYIDRELPKHGQI